MTNNSEASSPLSTATAEGEATRSPDAVLVHDPSPHGALDVLAAERDRDTLKERFLFRDWPDPKLFAAQHSAFVAGIESTGMPVLRLDEILGDHPALEAVAGNCNQVYTRDAIVTLPWVPETYIAGRMYAPIRQPERMVMEAAMEKLGIRRLVDVPEDLVLEGGDVIPFNRDGSRCLLVGFGRRTYRETLDFLAQELIPEHLDEILAVRLAPWRINLDGAMVPLTDDLIVTHPESLLEGVMIDANGTTEVDFLDTLRESGMDVIEVTRDESIYQQSCNFLCLGNRQVVCYDLTPRLLPLLAEREVDAVTAPGSELVKGTGGPRCMSRPIYR
jgi:N-dimethylarginine dimethylaminohydrolase